MNFAFVCAALIHFVLMFFALVDVVFVCFTPLFFPLCFARVAFAFLCAALVYFLIVLVYTSAFWVALFGAGGCCVCVSQ